jgi:hypothetical protein
VTHPAYAPPEADSKIAFVDLGSGFILMRPDWFASGLGIPKDSVHTVLERTMNTLLLAGARTRFPGTVTLPASARQNFLAETQKLDDEVYVKTKLPPQGIALAAPDTLDALLIVHECTLGADLNALDFYDYTKANAETSQTMRAHKLSLVATWTVWDNRKQLPLVSGISEAGVELKDGKASMVAIQEAVQKLQESIWE